MYLPYLRYQELQYLTVSLPPASYDGESLAKHGDASPAQRIRYYGQYSVPMFLCPSPCHLRHRHPLIAPAFLLKITAATVNKKESSRTFQCEMHLLAREGLISFALSIVPSGWWCATCRLLCYHYRYSLDNRTAAQASQTQTLSSLKDGLMAGLCAL